MVSGLDFTGEIGQGHLFAVGWQRGDSRTFRYSKKKKKYHLNNILPLAHDPSSFLPVSRVPFRRRCLDRAVYTHHLHSLTSQFLLHQFNGLLFPLLHQNSAFNSPSDLRVAKTSGQFSALVLVDLPGNGRAVKSSGPIHVPGPSSAQQAVNGRDAYYPLAKASEHHHAISKPPLPSSGD